MNLTNRAFWVGGFKTCISASKSWNKRALKQLQTLNIYFAIYSNSFYPTNNWSRRRSRLQVLSIRKEKKNYVIKSQSSWPNFDSIKHFSKTCFPINQCFFEPPQLNAFKVVDSPGWYFDLVSHHLRPWNFLPYPYHQPKIIPPTLHPSPSYYKTKPIINLSLHPKYKGTNSSFWKKRRRRERTKYTKERKRERKETRERERRKIKRKMYVKAVRPTDLNRNTEWFTYPGVWTTYILILFFSWLIVLSVLNCSPGLAWTIVHLSHFLVLSFSLSI